MRPLIPATLAAATLASVLLAAPASAEPYDSAKFAAELSATSAAKDFPVPLSVLQSMAEIQRALEDVGEAPPLAGLTRWNLTTATWDEVKTDGDGDGKADPASLADQVASVKNLLESNARYLREHAQVPMEGQITDPDSMRVSARVLVESFIEGVRLTADRYQAGTVFVPDSTDRAVDRIMDHAKWLEKSVTYTVK